MSIVLEKGGRINLSKDVPALRKIRVGLGWDANGTDTGTDFDLDATCFVLKNTSENKPVMINERYMIFYNNLRSPENAVVHSGDNRTGSGEGDDETIRVELALLPEETSELSFIVTIHEAVPRKQNFGQVKNAYIVLYNDESGAEVARYDLEEAFSTETAVQFGSLYKKDGQWLFKAVGAGYKLGLGEFVKGYGGDVA